MASEVSNPAQESLGLMDIAVERNAYGRQIDSRVVELEPDPEFESRTGAGQTGSGVHSRPDHPRSCRRAPGAGRSMQGDPVLVEQGRHLVATFHPELTGDARVHTLFLEKL